MGIEEIGRIAWADEPIEYLKRGNWLYKLVCFCLGKRKKKLSYKEMYMMLVELNRKTVGERESKTLAMEKILQFYKDTHNNKLPNELE